MANRTDPLISQVSGSDPQNLVEYLTRQRIYETRFWKETCFGLTVEHVLEESTKITKGGQGCVAIGHLNFMALLLKLLQLHPETDLVVETFVEQKSFKYTRALGALYVRLIGRPADIYVALEALYVDTRQVRNMNPYTSTLQDKYTMIHMDDYIHDLLTSTHVAGIALPRLAQRSALQDAGYLPGGPRPTVLQEALEQHGGPLAYLKHLALEQDCPEALEVWKSKYQAMDPEKDDKNEKDKSKSKKAKRQKLFKDSTPDTSTVSKDSNSIKTSTTKVPPQEGSEEYWNEERAKLGLAPLRK